MKQIQNSVLVSHTDLIIWMQWVSSFFRSSLSLVRRQNFILIYSSKKASKSLYCRPNYSDDLIVLHEKIGSV